MTKIKFEFAFECLTGHPPFPWQIDLFERLIKGDFPQAARIPTGLGKTLSIAVWLIALAVRPKVVPRRLVYVVNRRTVVDQSTAEAEKLRSNLDTADDVRQALTDLCAIVPDSNGETSSPLAISSLRGAFADNQEWLADPAQPAIVIGTVDMIGSRLLFDGYRCGFKSKPMHAAFLGQGTLLLHDEAHLEPAFQKLLTAIEFEQCTGRFPDRQPLRIIELTATSRGSTDGPSDDSATLRLQPADLQNSVVRQRLRAGKSVRFHSVEDVKSVPEAIIAHAIGHLDSGLAILVFVRRIADVEKVVAGLKKTLKQEKLREANVEQLTGTLRGFERDRLATANRHVTQDSVFSRFLPADDRADAVIPAEGTVFLVCTSAGEVGVNLSADHLVCDLTPLDSMAQRFGRVNRFGRLADDGEPHVATIDVIHEAEVDCSNPFEESRHQTRDVLSTLRLRDDGTRDGSPESLSLTLGQLTAEETKAAFSPESETLPVSDILFDAWAMTSIRGELPGRPPVAEWLHGVTPEWEPPETHVAWRSEVDKVDNVNHDVLALQTSTVTREDLLEAFPLKPHELLRDTTDRVFSHLQKLATHHGQKSVWIVDVRGTIAVKRLGEIADPAAKGPVAKRLKESLQWKTVLLGENTGGLSNGLFDGNAKSAGKGNDVSEEWITSKGTKRRVRVLRANDEARQSPSGMRLALSLTLRNPDELRESDVISDENADEQLTDETTREGTDIENESKAARADDVWDWYVLPRSADDDAISWQAPQKQRLVDHLAAAGRFAEQIVEKLGLESSLSEAVVTAARFHDLGKDRRQWQLGIGNHAYNANVSDTILAKSGSSGRPINRHYRHEFGTLLDMTSRRDVAASAAMNTVVEEATQSFQQSDELTQELILHLIAAHHGRGRPHFPTDESFDPEAAEPAATAMTLEVTQRFARLQRRYGRWGLAWLESLVRASDYAASSAGSDSKEAGQ